MADTKNTGNDRVDPADAVEADRDAEASRDGGSTRPTTRR